MILDILLVVAVIALIIILVKPSILKFFFEHPNRIKGFLFWLIAYTFLFYVCASTPFGQSEFKELIEKRARGEYPSPSYSKPDTTKKERYKLFPLDW
jgi:hypothetical protein